MTSQPDKIKLYTNKLNYYNKLMTGGDTITLDEKQYNELSNEEKNKYQWVEHKIWCKQYIGTSNEDILKQQEIERIKKQNDIEQLTQKLNYHERINSSEIELSPYEFTLLSSESSLDKYKNYYNWTTIDRGSQWD